MRKIPGLDEGETAAISLALELGGQLLIDELQGRSQAQSAGVTVIGSLGILELAANSGMIADLATVHEAIRGVRFHIAEWLLRESLERHRAIVTTSP